MYWLAKWAFGSVSNERPKERKEERVKGKSKEVNGVLGDLCLICRLGVELESDEIL